MSGLNLAVCCILQQYDNNNFNKFDLADPKLGGSHETTPSEQEESRIQTQEPAPCISFIPLKITAGFQGAITS